MFFRCWNTSRAASRINRICSTDPLSKEDFEYLITDHESSPVKEIEKLYGVSLGLTDSDIESMAGECYKSGLGIRAVRSKLMEMADDIVYKQFEKSEADGHNLYEDSCLETLPWDGSEEWDDYGEEMEY